MAFSVARKEDPGNGSCDKRTATGWAAAIAKCCSRQLLPKLHCQRPASIDTDETLAALAMDTDFREGPHPTIGSQLGCRATAVNSQQRLPGSQIGVQAHEPRRWPQRLWPRKQRRIPILADCGTNSHARKSARQAEPARRWTTVRHRRGGHAAANHWSGPCCSGLCCSGLDCLDSHCLRLPRVVPPNRLERERRGPPRQSRYRCGQTSAVVKQPRGPLGRPLLAPADRANRDRRRADDKRRSIPTDDSLRCS